MGLLPTAQRPVRRRLAGCHPACRRWVACLPEGRQACIPGHRLAIMGACLPLAHQGKGPVRIETTGSTRRSSSTTAGHQGRTVAIGTLDLQPLATRALATTPGALLCHQARVGGAGVAAAGVTRAPTATATATRRHPHRAPTGGTRRRPGEAAADEERRGRRPRTASHRTSGQKSPGTGRTKRSRKPPGATGHASGREGVLGAIAGMHGGAFPAGMQHQDGAYGPVASCLAPLQRPKSPCEGPKQSLASRPKPPRTRATSAATLAVWALRGRCLGGRRELCVPDCRLCGGEGRGAQQHAC